jgi:hypothetical protein
MSLEHVLELSVEGARAPVATSKLRDEPRASAIGLWLWLPIWHLGADSTRRLAEEKASRTSPWLM